jgi:O-antigen/teichoic acid export membrane protein
VGSSRVAAVLSYGKWIVGASLMAGVNAWLAVLAVGYFVGTRAAGEYAAAHMLIGACDVLMLSLNTVFLPAACQVASRSAGAVYLKQALRVSSLLSAALLPAYFLAGPLIALVYSPAFEASVPAFRILFWGFLVTLNVHPVLLILHSKDRPELIAGLECFQLVLHTLACALLIPWLAVVGAALATTFSRLASGMAGLFLVHTGLQHQPKGEQ